MRGIRFSSCLAALVGLSLLGCAVGAPPPAPESDRLPALSVADVIKFLKEGVSRRAILFRIRTDGIESHPTVAEIADLRDAGAGEEFIQELLTAPVASDDGRPAFIEEQIPPFPDLWPAFGWTWHQGRWHLIPWTTGRPRPD
jgi:hypothetical protein